MKMEMSMKLEIKKEKTLNLIHWFRQGIAIICGAIWGVIEIKGIIGIIGYRYFFIFFLLLFFFSK